MMKAPTPAAVLCVAAWFFGQPALPGQEGGAQALRGNRVPEFLKQIQTLRAKKDAKGLQQLGADVKAAWLEKKSPEFHTVIYELCLALNATNRNDPAATAMVRDLAASVIDSSTENATEEVVKLLLFLQSDSDYSKGELKGDAWIKERAIRAERWLKVWQSIRDQRAGLPQLSGRKKQDLDVLEKMVAGSAKRYLVEAFCKPPFQTAQFEAALEKYDVAKDHRLAMLEQVRRRESASVERDSLVAKKPAKKPDATKALASPPVGANVDAMQLAQDPKLQIAMSVNMTKPKVGDLLELLSAKTGLQIAVRDGIDSDRLAFWSISHHNVPAWSVMTQFADGVVDNGNWVKEENGYRLFGELKPRLETLVTKQRDADKSAPGDLDWGKTSVVIGSIASIVLISGWIVIRRWKAAPGSQQ